MNSGTPDKKVTLGAFVSALCVVIIWIVQTATNIVIPAEIGMSMQLAVVGIVQYIVRREWE